MAFKSFTAAVTGAVAGPIDAGAGKTFRQFNLKVLSPVADAQVALETSPDGSTWTQMATARGQGWGYARSDHVQREARVNVVSLGTGGAGRSDSGCATVNTSVTVTDAAAVASDLSKYISGPGIPAGTVINAVSVGVGYTISNPATATAGSLTFVVGVQPLSAVICYY